MLREHSVLNSIIYFSDELICKSDEPWIWIIIPAPLFLHLLLHALIIAVVKKEESRVCIQFYILQLISFEVFCILILVIISCMERFEDRQAIAML
mmetsp:Transcript_20103/g.26038  ORF Transcript_20103/g.26038 Transcript_20103/m.26038 type:complete len:95 (+) Transcript_20103:659-943(+)